jgi:hypothetical protein
MAAIEHAEVLLGIVAGLLAYVVVVQALMAATVLLCEFIVLRVRVLRTLLAEAPRPVPAPAREVHEARAEDQGVYVIGGNIRRWE